jgi:aspartyl-tRNA(Asn)/glutamyl-tRNA(Gln) amidotransferase subunit A
MALMQKTIRELAPLIQNKELSPVELTQECFERIDQTEPAIHAYITTMRQQALQDAKRAEEEIMHGGYRGILHGIPYSAKDLYKTRGIRTTAGSEVLAENISRENAAVIDRLNQAGAILVGKNNLHEFAFGTTNENEYFGSCRNPRDTRMISGGSSGGSAASVAAGSSLFSLGTDTGGSIRIPSALCGVTGLKPTYGRVSKRGIIPLSWSLDHAGPLAKTVWDTAAVLAVIAGYDAQDAASARQAVPDYLRRLDSFERSDVRNLRIGICPEYGSGQIHPDIEKAFQQVLQWFEACGAKVREFSYPMAKMGRVRSIISMAEAYAYHVRYLEKCPEKYGDQVRRRLEKSQYIPAHAYINALRLRRQDMAEWVGVYQDIDLFIAPTTLIPAFPIGQQTVRFGPENVNPRIHGTLMLITGLSDLNGYPAISIPCGFTAERLPIGLQIQGRPFAEELVLQTAYAYEQTHSSQRNFPVL